MSLLKLLGKYGANTTYTKPEELDIIIVITNNKLSFGINLT